ncbi:MAG: radical SAM protein [Gemmatimonadetes bacterium]|nr:radical SAM protein [Gemmatimonadota bacterium]
MHSASLESPRILLAHSYYLAYDPKQTQKMRPYPPLATLITASVLRQHGYEVDLFDAMLARGVEAFHSQVDAMHPSIVAIVEDNFNFLTKMCTLRMREAALDMVASARAAGARVVVNGSDAADRPDLYLVAGADAVIPGDPEPAVLDLVAAWTGSNGLKAEAVPGIIIAAPQNGETRRTAPRPALDDLDHLPFPAWDLLDAGSYRRAWTAAHGRLSWNMATSRGCPYRCNWCAKPLFGKRYAQRSPENVAGELDELRHAIAPDHVWFADDIFGLTPAWIEAFARAVSARGARTPFTMQSRANLMKPRAVAALAEAGAEEVWLGVESGSQQILNAMDKGTTVAQVREATRELRRHGIRCGWFIQLGYRGEQWPDLVATRNLVRDEWPDDIGVSVSYPLPGTKFYEQVRTELGRKTNWADSDDLAMMFRGTYVTEFYKRVRDLLHTEVRARQARDAEWDALERHEPDSRSPAGYPAPP